MEQRAREVLADVTTATITTILLKQGLRNVWMRGTLPLALGQRRIVGPAFTMRFIPAREDMATPAAWTSPTSTRAAIEAMPEGCVVVADAMGITDAGVAGDILTMRMKMRGVAGLVTDGVMRDTAGVMETGLPIYCRGTAAPAAVTGMIFAGWQDPIGCGGVAVFPGDIVVADTDGAVVIPAASLDHVLDHATEQERLEGWIMDKVRKGAALPGLYPMNDETRARYEAWRKGRG